MDKERFSNENFQRNLQRKILEAWTSLRATQITKQQVAQSKQLKPSNENNCR